MVGDGVESMKRVLLGLCLSSLGCGSDPVSATPDAGSIDGGMDSDAAAEVFPAFPPDLPRVLNAGGPTMKDPVVVPIVFANEDPAKVTKLTDFLSKLPGSSYWSQTTKEYGVDSITIAPVVTLTESAPASITDGEIAAWLTDAIANAKVPANQPEKSLYVIYYPQTTTTINGGQQSCTEYGGYHSEVGGVIFAVINGCASYSARTAPGETLLGFDFITGLTSHELLEAVTDPFYATKPAYRTIDNKHKAWSLYLYGAEVADTCELQPNAFYKDPGIGYTVQRSWSNQAADQNHDPCVPAIGTPWVAAFPVSPPLGVPIVDGGATIPIRLVSDGPTNGFSVKAIDYASEHGKPAQLALSLDKSSGKNGDTLTLAVQVLAIDPTKYEGFILETDVGGVKRRTAGVVH